MIVAWALATALAGAPTEVEVPPPSSEAPAPARIVVGVVRGDAPFSDSALDDRLLASFVGTSLAPNVEPLGPGDLLDRMEWARATAQEDVRAVYWVEPLDAGRHRLYLFDPRTEQTWVRSLPQGSDPDDVLDTLATMVRSLSDGLPDGAPRGMQKVPSAISTGSPAPTPEPSVRPEPEPAAPRRRTHVMIAASYAGASFDARMPWQSGGAIAIDVELPVAAFVRIGASVLQPVRLPEPRADVWRVPVDIVAGYRFRRDRRVRPELGLALAIDPITWRARESAARSGRTARVGLGPEAGLVVRLWRGLGLHLWARADIWLHNVTLVVADGTGRESRLRPHPVAALLHAGLHFVF